MDTTALDAAISALSSHRPDRPELPPVGELALHLLRLQRETLAAIPVVGPPSMEVAHERLREGGPALRFRDLQIEPETYHQTWVRAVELCADDGALTSAEVGDLLAEGESGDRLLRLTQPWFEHGADDSISLRSDLTPEIISIAAKPWLLAAAERVAEVVSRDEWTASGCPACGGEPDLAVAHTHGPRTLVCSRCDTLWPWPHDGCPFCHSGPENVRLHEGPSPGYYLQECLSCGRALKSVQGGVLGEDLSPAAERVFAAHLDHLAAQLNLTT